MCAASPEDPSNEQADNPYRAPRTLETVAADPPSADLRDGNGRRSIAPLFCPECGTYYSDSTCKLNCVRWSLDRLCPRCDRRLWLAGWVFPVIGVVIGFPLMLVLDRKVEALGIMLTAVLTAMGVMRIVNERLIRRKVKKPEH